MEILLKVILGFMMFAGVVTMGGLGFFFGLLIKDSMSKDPEVRAIASRYMNIG
jgi:Na+-driven multidrug efflux pump